MDRVVAAVAIGLGVFHLLNVAGLQLLSALDIRIVHLAGVCTVMFLTTPLSKRFDPFVSGRLLPTMLSLAFAAYLLNRWSDIAQSGQTNELDLYAGVLLLLLVLEATRRAIGWVLALITTAFLVYPFLSPYLPGVLHGRGVSANRVASFLTTTTEGVYGIPLGVAATYIIMFSLFGAVLNEFGAGDYVFRAARRITRGMRAASAKTAVLFSSLLGMISGSSAGNVAVTGSFTIPMMKKEGYAPRQAAAIEAVVSTGGQLLPPVMGAAAFIMAEIVGTPYVNVMKAAVIPALLFFASILFVVHLQAEKDDIGVGDGESEHRAAEGLLREGIPFILPFGMLVGLMIVGYSPFKACFVSMLALIATYAAANREFGIDLAEKLLAAIRRGVTAAVPVSIACAAAGIISGSLAVSGLGIKISGIIISTAGGVAFVAMVLTMLVAIVLGMGLPTTAAYLILATVVAPSLAELGVPLLTAHLFVFFYGCVSTITPPVALASYVAAGIAGADINKVGWTAFAYGITCYLLPFMFFFGPALMLDAGPFDVLLAAATGLVGVYAVAVAVIGQMKNRLGAGLRLAAAVAGVLLLLQGWITDLAGLAVLTGLHLASRP